MAVYKWERHTVRKREKTTVPYLSLSTAHAQ